MDKFDQAIIQALKYNARQSISNIAQQVSLSRSSVTARIKSMEQKKIIRGYQVLLSDEKSSAVSAYIEIHYASNCCVEFIEVFKKIPEIVTCHSITGNMDLLLFVKAPSMQRLHEIREYVESHSDISKMKTHVVMNEWINTLGGCEV